MVQGILFSILPQIIMEKNIYVKLNQFDVWQKWTILQYTFLFIKISGLYICNETLHGSKNAQTEMTKKTDQFWDMTLSQ